MRRLCTLLLATLFLAWRVAARGDVALQLSEEQPVGTRLARVLELLRNASQLRGVRYSRPTLLRNGSYFSIDDGWLVQARRLDRETLCPSPDPAGCHLTLLVGVQLQGVEGETGATATVRVRVELLDVDDNPPRWNVTNRRVTLRFHEHTPVGAQFFVARTFDADYVATRSARYLLQDTRGAFTLRTVPASAQRHVTDVYLVVQRDLDRETLERFDLRVCIEGPAPYMLEADACLTVDVQLLDVNDHPPLIANRNASLSVPEDHPLHVPLLRIHASDRDVGVNAELGFRFSPLTRQAHAALFDVDERGVLTLRAPLDFETSKTHKLFVEVFDKSQYPATSTATVNVAVIDVIDEFPDVDVLPWLTAYPACASTQSVEPNRLIKLSVINLKLEENNAARIPIADVRVSDADSADNGRLLCSLHHQKQASSYANFDFSPLIPGQNVEYTLVLNNSLDREYSHFVQVQLACSDSGTPPRTSIVQINICISDVNDNAPVFSKANYTATIDEATLPGHTILRVDANDLDAGANGSVYYRIEQVSASYFHNESLLNHSYFAALLDPSRWPFVIDQAGSITLVKALDRESVATWRLRVTATDGGTPPRSASTNVIIHVADANDNRPTFPLTGYYFRVPENVMMGTFVGEVRATDADALQNQEIDYFIVLSADIGAEHLAHTGARSLSVENFPFTVDERGRLTVISLVDREQKSPYRFAIVARDRGLVPLSNSVPVVCDVIDENDNTPVFVLPSESHRTINVTEPLAVGVPFSVVRAIDPDSDANGRVTYSIRRMTALLLPRTDQHDVGMSERTTQRVARQLIVERPFELFAIDLLNGELVLRREIRENDNWKQYELLIEATDQASIPRSAIITLRVSVRIDDDVLIQAYQPTFIDAASRGLRIDSHLSILDNTNFIIVLSLCCVAVFFVLLVAVAILRPLYFANRNKRSSSGRTNSRQNRTQRRRNTRLRKGDVKVGQTPECQKLVSTKCKRETLMNEHWRLKCNNLESEYQSRETATEHDCSVQVYEYSDCSIRAATTDQHYTHLRPFNTMPNKRTAARMPRMNLMCETLSEYLQLQNGIESTTYNNPLFNIVRRSSCTLCKSNTVSDFGDLQRSFNERSPRRTVRNLRSCDSSPHSFCVREENRSVRSPEKQRRVEMITKHSTHSLSCCGDYRPDNSKERSSNEPSEISAIKRSLVQPKQSSPSPSARDEDDDNAPVPQISKTNIYVNLNNSLDPH